MSSRHLSSHLLSNRMASAFDNYFLQAQRVRKLVKSDFDRVFAMPNPLTASWRGVDEAGVDVLVHASAIRTAPPLPSVNAPDEKNAAGDSLDAYTQDVLTVPASLAGLPALSVPAGGGVDGWPVGVSVVGQWGCEEMVLRVGEMLDSVRESL